MKSQKKMFMINISDGERKERREEHRQQQQHQ